MSANEITSKSLLPTWQKITRKANNINNEPNNVYRNSKNEARTRSALAPQIPIIKNSGISTDSKNTQNNNKSNTKNIAISRLSSTSKAIIYDLILCLTLSQLANTQIGKVKVVNNTK